MKVNSDEITKKALVEKYGLELLKKDEEIKKLNREILALEKKVKELNRGLSIYSTDDEIVKKVLEMRSTYLSPVRIREKLQYLGLDIDVDSIKDIIYNISELSIDLQIFFKECEEKYEKEIKINPQSLRDSSIKEITYLMDLAMESIEASDDPNEKDKYIRTFKDLLNTKTSILKDVVFGEDEDTQDGLLKKIALGLSNNDSKVINNLEESFSMDGIEVM